MGTAYLTHPACVKHDMAPNHPECPERIGAIEDRLIAAGVMDFLLHREVPLATKAQLSHVHTTAHIENIFAESPESGLVAIDPDTSMNPHSLEASLRAAGAVVRATDMVIKGEVNNAFCCVRPPGHHAERAQAMGFCFFNSIAVGAAHALEEHGLERVAIVDFDVHHGNGTEDIFEDEPRVMVCSSYQHPLYPYSGRPTIPGRLINVPLERGSGGDVFRPAIEKHWLPALEEFRPQMIFISAGFDAHHEDPLAELNLTEADYLWITDQIMAVANRHSKGRIVSSLEGGYALSALGRSATVHVKALMDI